MVLSNAKISQKVAFIIAYKLFWQRHFSNCIWCVVQRKQLDYTGKETPLPPAATVLHKHVYLALNLRHHCISVSVNGRVCTENKTEFGRAVVRLLCCCVYEWMNGWKRCEEECKQEQANSFQLLFPLPPPLLNLCPCVSLLWESSFGSLSNLLSRTTTMDPFYCDTSNNELSSVSATLCRRHTQKQAHWCLSRHLHARVVHAGIV